MTPKPKTDHTAKSGFEAAEAEKEEPLAPEKEEEAKEITAEA